MNGKHRFESAIIACARWEQPYIVEWVQYHLALGFEHIYLYCNDDEPSSLRIALGDLTAHQRGQVTYRTFHGQGRQLAMYIDALRQAKQEAEWICFLDIDEFLVLKAWRSITELIDNLNAQCVVSLHFNWLFYGNNNHVTRPTGSVLRNYTRRANLVDVHTKHISRSSCFEAERIERSTFPFWHGLADPHWTGFNRCNVLGDQVGSLLVQFPFGMTSYLADIGRSADLVARAYVAHFAFKSADDFRLRVARGLGGNFGGQVKWQRAIETGETADILRAMNEVEDTYLRDRVANQ